MKKLVLFLLILPCVLFERGISQINIRVTGPLADLSNAITGNWTSVTVQNASPFYAEAYILCVPFSIDPGCGIHDSWPLEFNNSRIPIVFNFFSDPEHKNLVGVWAEVMNIRKNESHVYVVNKVKLLNGNFYYANQNSFHPQPKKFVVTEVDMPRASLASSNVVEVINGTMFDVVITGRAKLCGFSNVFKKDFWVPFAYVDTLKPGQVFFYDFNDISRSQKISFSITFLDDGRMRGFGQPVDFFLYSGSFSGPKASQRLLVANDIRSY